MSKQSRLKLLNTLIEIINKYDTLPPAIENTLNIIESKNEDGELLKRITDFIELNTPKKIKVKPLEKGGKEMAEKVEFEKYDFDTQAYNRHESFRRRLDCVYQDQLVVVEFCCGKLLKKAKGCCNLIGCDFIELVAPTSGQVEIDIISKMGKIMTEYACRILIKLDRVCAVELQTFSPCPPCPPCPPCKTDE